MSFPHSPSLCSRNFLVAAFLAAVFLTVTTLAVAGSRTAAAAEPTILPLWPDTPGGTTGAPGSQGTSPGDRPHMRIYLAPVTEAQKGQQTEQGQPPKNQTVEAAPTPVVVVVPGGGYGGLANGHEGTEIAAWLNDLGVSAVVCMYRHRNSGAGYGYPYPIMDVQRCISVVRAHADEWNIDPERLGVIGFSAGGHLVTSVCTTDSLVPTSDDPIDRQSCRPDFAIVCYPVIALGRPYTHLGSQRNLLGDNVPRERLDELSTDRRVSPETPPTFLWHTAEDPVVPVQNALVYYEALVRNGVPADLHVFEKGRHGLGLARPRQGDSGLPAKHWPQLCVDWLRQHKFID